MEYWGRSKLAAAALIQHSAAVSKCSQKNHLDIICFGGLILSFNLCLALGLVFLFSSILLCLPNSKLAG